MNKQDKEHSKTRQRILQVACRVFATQGFRKTTIRDICQQAEVNVAAVNYYFSSKEKLYEAVCKYVLSLSVKDADPGFKLGKSKKPEERLKCFIQTFLLNIFGNEQSNWGTMIMGRELIEPTNALNIVIKKIIKPHFQQLHVIIKRLLGEGTKDEIVRRCCLSITGQCLYYRFARPVILQLNPHQKFDNAGIEKLANHITQFSLNAIKQLALENKKKG